MNIHTFVRERPLFDDEATMQRKIAQQYNIFAFNDLPSQEFETDSYYSNSDTTKILFERQIKNLIDVAILQNCHPLILLFGDSLTGKTFTCEGNIKLAYQKGLLQEIIEYLLTQQANIQVSQITVLSDKLYDCLQENFTVLGSQVQVSERQKARQSVNSVEQLNLLIQKSRQSNKQIGKLNKQGNKVYTIYYQIKDRLAQISIVDSQLFSDQQLNLQLLQIIKFCGIAKQTIDQQNISLKTSVQIQSDYQQLKKSVYSAQLHKSVQKQKELPPGIRSNKLTHLLQDCFVQQQSNMLVGMFVSGLEKYHQFKQIQEFIQIIFKQKKADLSRSAVLSSKNANQYDQSNDLTVESLKNSQLNTYRNDNQYQSSILQQLHSDPVQHNDHHSAPQIDQVQKIKQNLQQTIQQVTQNMKQINDQDSEVDDKTQQQDNLIADQLNQNQKEEKIETMRQQIQQLQSQNFNLTKQLQNEEANNQLINDEVCLNNVSKQEQLNYDNQVLQTQVLINQREIQQINQFKQKLQYLEDQNNKLIQENHELKIQFQIQLGKQNSIVDNQQQLNNQLIFKQQEIDMLNQQQGIDKEKYQQLQQQYNQQELNNIQTNNKIQQLQVALEDLQTYKQITWEMEKEIQEYKNKLSEKDVDIESLQNEIACFKCAWNENKRVENANELIVSMRQK